MCKYLVYEKKDNKQILLGTFRNREHIYNKLNISKLSVGKLCNDIYTIYSETYDIYRI